MKKVKSLLCLIFSLLLAFSFSISVFADSYIQAWQSEDAMYGFDSFVKSVQNDCSDKTDIKLYPGGMPFGVRIISKGLYVVGFSETDGNECSSAFRAGVRLGDIILKLNNTDINKIEDFKNELSRNGEKPATVTVKRGNSILSFTFTPKYFKNDNSYKAGLMLKDSTSGIGTVTFISPETGAFGGLGHGICDANTGNVIPLSKGIIMDVSINGVTKGKVGNAGELKGVFNTKKIGKLTVNSSSGVFGIISLDKVDPPEEPLSIAYKEEVKKGEAYIWCTLDGSGPKKYKVYIYDIDTSCSSIKNFRVKITDPELLNTTGGIVQGMSGSPIIQNGKIIGAVTHVLVNDPTTGYGIFIENMLSAMPETLK